MISLPYELKDREQREVDEEVTAVDAVTKFYFSISSICYKMTSLKCSHIVKNALFYKFSSISNERKGNNFMLCERVIRLKCSISPGIRVNNASPLQGNNKSF